MDQPIAEGHEEFWTGVIESLAHDGLGVGIRIGQSKGKEVKRPVFVPFTVPGDTVKAPIIGTRGKYAFGGKAEIIVASPKRVTPRCRHFGVCGGCNLQHIAYEEQLRQKGLQASFLLSRRGIPLPRGMESITVLPAVQRERYRWRSKIAMRFSDDGVIAGFRAHRSRDIVRVEECFIVVSEILDLITLLNDEKPIGQDGEQELMVTRGHNGKLGVLVPFDDIPRDLREARKAFFEGVYSRNRALIANMFFTEEGKIHTCGQVQEHITYQSFGIEFSFMPGTFIQANIPTNDLLVKTVVGFVARGKHDTVIDLYAGIGNITLPVAKDAKSVVSVEGDSAGSELALINAVRNGITNVKTVRCPVEEYARKLAKSAADGTPDETYPSADCVIIDPPRTGCTPPVLHGLLRAAAPRIVYVSCNPVTLAEDLVVLCEKYSIDDIVGVDMFPDISHVETIALLKRKDQEG